ncbi:gustatory receptor for sugar taste 64a-like [Argopecten irradians]|uniref:gustatory receptor for sugar taste 64a-like n=1 Tax=Argopecten irradians TaxID=31199 RepID=UPI00371C4896
MMKIFGLYFAAPSPTEMSELDSEQTVSKHKPRAAFFKWYSVFMTVLSGLNVARYLPSFWVGVDFVPHLTVSRVTMICWIVQCFLYRLFLLRACWSSHRLPEYFNFFDQLMTDSCCIHLKPSCMKSRRFLVVIITLVWLVIVLVSASGIFYMATDVEPEYMVTICNPFPDKTGVKIAFLIFHTIEIGAWTFPVAFLVTLFRILGDAFSSYTNELCKITKDERAQFWEKMEDIRVKHLQLCKAMTILNRDTKYLITVNFTTGIFLVCFNLYQMVATNSAIHVLGYVRFSFWLVLNFSFMTSLSVTAANVNEKAHSPLEYIFDVEMDDVSRSESLQLQLFLSKLNGPAIGFTVMGLITITKELILTLAGLVLTYFFLLLQFNI